MGVETISAITLAVTGMARSVVFYRDFVGLEMLYGGEETSFTSFSVGRSLRQPDSARRTTGVVGRLILYVDDVDAHYERLTGFGLNPSTVPEDARWGERYFHIDDPDGHELSFARPIPGGRQG